MLWIILLISYVLTKHACLFFQVFNVLGELGKREGKEIKKW